MQVIKIQGIGRSLDTETGGKLKFSFPNMLGKNLLFKLKFKFKLSLKVTL